MHWFRRCRLKLIVLPLFLCFLLAMFFQPISMAWALNNYAEGHWISNSAKIVLKSDEYFQQNGIKMFCHLAPFLMTFLMTPCRHDLQTMNMNWTICVKGHFKKHFYQIILATDMFIKRRKRCVPFLMPQQHKRHSRQWSCNLLNRYRSHNMFDVRITTLRELFV